jgi:hypothetical protein
VVNRKSEKPYPAASGRVLGDLGNVGYDRVEVTKEKNDASKVCSRRLGDVGRRRQRNSPDLSRAPAHMVVGYAVGGPTDTIARIMAERMKVALGQPVIVENVTGAAGSIAGAGSRAPRPTATRSAWATGARTSSIRRCTICNTMW